MSASASTATKPTASVWKKVTPAQSVSLVAPTQPKAIKPPRKPSHHKDRKISNPKPLVPLSPPVYMTRNDIQLSRQCPKVDSDEEFEMFQDNQVTWESSVADRRNRGVVIQKRTGYVMSRAHGFVSQFSIDMDAFEQETEKWLSYPIMMFPSYEGSILRLWSSPTTGRWYLSTTRKLDAFHSYFITRETFGEQFSRLLQDKIQMTYPDFCKGLDPQHVYTFLLTNPPKANTGEHPPAQQLFSFGWFDRTRQFSFTFGEIQGIECPTPIPRVHRNAASVADYVQNIRDAYVLGVTMIHRETGEMCKITSLEQKSIQLTKVGVPNILLGYLQTTNPVQYRELYPLDVPTFDILDIEYQKFIAYIKREFDRIQEHSLIINYCPDYQGVVKYCLKNLNTMFKNRKFQELDDKVVRDYIQNEMTCPKDQHVMVIPRFALDLLRYLCKKGKIEIESMLRS